MDRLFNILEEVRPDVDFRGTNHLVSNNYIDSFDIVTIISYVEEEFGIDVPVDMMIMENFESAENMMAMIQSIVR